MPFKFWKRDKSEKEKGEAEDAKKKAASPKAEAGARPKASVVSPPARSSGPDATVPRVAVPKVTPVKAEAPPPATLPAAEVEAVVAEAHAGLVDLGLTIPGTKVGFSKRVADFPGGAAAFVALYRSEPHHAGTQILASWLGFSVHADFDPAKLLADVNLRLSSFKLAVQMTDLTWLDEELSLRKAHLHLHDQEKVVRFKDARDFVKGVNELIAPRNITFIELETWSSDRAFLLVRDPKWDKLAATTLVVVKAPQTAVGGESGECGAPVGTNWHDYLTCGAVFGPD